MDYKKRLREEVAKIETPSIKIFTHKALDKADAGFWTDQ